MPNILTNDQIISAAYVAIFQRAPDLAGLNNWRAEAASQQAQGKSGVDLAKAIASGFAAHEAFTTVYGALSNEAFIDAIYTNIGGKVADTAGKINWLARLNDTANPITRGQLVGEFTYGVLSITPAELLDLKNTNKITPAEYTDAVARQDRLTNKADVAVKFTQALGANSNIAIGTDTNSLTALNNDPAFSASKAIIAGVTEVDATMTAPNNYLAGTPTVAGVNATFGVAGSNFTLTAGADNIAGTAASETITGVISATATSTTFNSTDNIIDTSSSDADVLTLTIEADVTADNSGLVRGIETVNVNANATTLGASTTSLDFAATNFSNAKALNFDVTKAATAVDTLNVTALAINNVTVTASDDFVATTVATTGGTGQNLTVDAKAAGSAGAATSVEVTAPGITTIADVTVTGTGYLNAKSNASTGLLSATAAKNLTLSGTAAKVIKATSTGGNVTISDAAASVNTTVNATGDVSISLLSAAGKVNVTAGGTIVVDATGATSAVLSGVGASTIGTANGLTSLSISGNGGAATYTMATSGSDKLVDVAVSGDKNVGLKLDASSVGGTAVNANALNVVDTGSGTFTLELSSTVGAAAGDVDLRGGNLIDNLVVGIDNVAKTLSVGTGQTVTYKVDQTNATIAVGTAANEAANTVTVKLDDAVRDSAAADLTKLTITQAKTVTIDASVDTSAAGAAVKHVIGALDASAAKSNVTINMGVNNVELTGASTVSATGSVIVTGSGTLTDTTATLVAGTLDASAMTGAVELDGTTLTVGTIKTGSANDKLKLTALADTAVQTGAGNDTVTLAAGDYKNTVVNLDLGTGTLDTLKFLAGTKLIKGTSGTVSLAGVETIEFADGTGQEVQGALLNGQTYNVISAATGNKNEVAVKVASSDTTVDLSKLVGSAAVETSVAAMTFVTDASANTSATAIKGVAAAKNSITGSAAGGDSLVGGAKADTFNYESSTSLFTTNTLLDSISGGDGNDIINFTTLTGTAVTVAATDSWANASSVEQITAVNATPNGNSAAISLTLGATAQTAGINTIDLSGDTNAGGVNVINVSAFTSGVTITGSVGNGVDNITGGSGNDTIVYKATADIGINAFIDSIVGGDGTDTIQLGFVGATPAGDTAADLTADGSFSRVSSVEVIKAVATTAATSVALDVTAYAAGIRTVDLSAAKHATSNVITATEITGGGLTLIGSATGVTTVTGGEGNDTISGGSANDIFAGGLGNDSISLVAGGTDIVVLSKLGGYDTITGFTAGASTVTGYDILKFGTGVGTFSLLEDAAPYTLADHDIVVAKEKVTEFNYILTGTALATSGDGSGLIAGLKTVTGDAALKLTVAVSDTGFLVAYQGGNAYVYSYANSATALDVTLDAGEITLVGVLNGVAAGALDTANFATII